MVEPTVEPTVPPPEPAPRRRRRFSRVLLAILVVFVALAVGAGFMARSARQDRTGAVKAHDEASSRLDAQQVASDAAQAQLDQTRRSDGAINGSLATPIATAQHAADLADQAMAVYRDIQRFAESGAPSGFNDAVTRANALVKEYNDTVDQLGKELDAASNPAVPT